MPVQYKIKPAQHMNKVDNPHSLKIANCHVSMPSHNHLSLYDLGANQPPYVNKFCEAWQIPLLIWKVIRPIPLSLRWQDNNGLCAEIPFEDRYYCSRRLPSQDIRYPGLHSVQITFEPLLIHFAPLFITLYAIFHSILYRYSFHFVTLFTTNTLYCHLSLHIINNKILKL